MSAVPATTKPDHPRMSGEDRRRQLIDVAIDLFSRKGFSGTTTKEIAAAAGVTEAIIFRHFATKEDLYKAILDTKCAPDRATEWLAEAQVFMDTNDDEGLFRLLLAQILRGYREETQFKRLMLYAALEGHDLAIMHHNQIKLPIGFKLLEYIGRRQAEGALRGCNPVAILYALAGIPEAYAMHKYIHKEAFPNESDEPFVDTFVAILMDGLRVSAKEGHSN